MTTHDSAIHRTGIQRLPLELFSDNILLSCLPHDTFHSPQKDQAPLSVSQVCQSWRSAAFSTPRLWTSIHADFSGRGKLDVATAIIPLMDLWLSRSLNHPLAISLDIDRQDRPMEFLSRYLSRTQQLRISTVGGMGFEGATIFTSTPRLTNLTLERLSFDEVTRMLVLCPDIRSLVLTISGPHVRPKQHIVLSQLSTLIVTSKSFKHLFQLLTLPKLSILECTSPYGKAAWPQLYFRDFYKRSMFSLTVLKLHQLDIRESELNTLLTCNCSTLTELTIQGPPTCVSDFLLDHLRIDPFFPTICPKLSTLYLLRCVAADCSDGALAAPIHSRSNIDRAGVDPVFREVGHVHLQVVGVSSDIQSRDLEELLYMRRHGLIVEVYDAKSPDRLLDI